ncbi:histidine--tRNA ligase [Clostridium sp. CAG:440]|nr:histidine--tRNA ligase [Clostridium sp. CAG:440]
MKGKVQPKTLPGFMELLPNEQILFNKMKEIIQKSYEKYGFLPLDTPIIEDANVLLAKAGGETEKQIYKLKKGENDLALRFDLTVPLAKYVTEYYDKLSFPFKRYQIGKVYRGEKPQRGRYREFYQCDVDIIGDGELSIINDAEIPSIIYNTFKKLGFDDFTICINNRKILNGLFSSLELEDISPEILRIIDKIEKIGKEEVRRELLISIPEKKVDVIMQFLEIKGKNEEKIQALESMNIDNAIFKEGINEIKEVSKFIKIFGVPEENYKIDLTIARGLDYYTGTVYETFLNQYKNLGSICSGGRYDNLTEYYTERKMPGVGISIGLSRLFFQLVDNEIISANEESITDVLIISMTEDCEMCAKIASKLREEDINVQINIEQQKLGKKFKYANNINARYVIIIGEDEIKNNVITLKDMSSGEQNTITLEETITVVQKAKNKD